MTRTITVDEFKIELRSQGVRSHEHFAFRCPICGTIQSARDLIAAGAGNTFDEIQQFLAFSCVGRWTSAGPHKKSNPSNHGCDWTLGGLFQCHNLTVTTADGKTHPRFEPATPAEAQANQAKHDSLVSSQ